MKKEVLIIIALSAICFGLNAQSLSTKKAKNYRDTKAVSVTARPLDVKLQQGEMQAQFAGEKQVKAFNTFDVQQVIYSKEGKNGSQYRIVELKNGQIRKQLISPARKPVNKIASNRINHVIAANEDATFYEGFEGLLNSSTANWLPVGWTINDKSNTGAGFTWQILEDAGAFAGRCIAGVPFAYEESGNNLIYNPSDEWLITPAITPKTGDKLIFKLNYNAGWLLFNQDTEAAFDVINQEIEVLISTDNGTNWTKVWDVLADARTYSEDDLWNQLEYGAPWTSFLVDISTYAGQNIKFAFRSNNRLGDSVFLDEVKVGLPSVEALYRQPMGYFYWTFNENYDMYSSSALLGPAYLPTRWYNFSSEDAETFLWQFTDPTFASDNPVEFSDVHPVITYPYAQFDLPVLTASAANAGSSTYVWDGLFVQTGGSAEAQSTTGESTALGAGNYDLGLGFSSGQYSATGYIFGTGSMDFWGAKLDAIANYFEKPLSKYLIDKFWISCGQFVASPDAELQLIIRRVGEDGSLKDTITTSVCYGADVQKISTDNNGYSYYTIPFTFKDIDPETGREVDTYLEIEDALLVELKYTEGQGQVTSIDPFFQSENGPTLENNAYIYLIANDRRYFFPVSELLTPDTYTSFLFNMNAIYPFLYTEDNKYDAPANGGTKNFDIIPYWNPDGWWLEEELPDWIEVGTPTNTSTGVSLPVTVAALPSGTAGRSANIKIASYACDLTLQVKQGDADWLSTGIAPLQTSAGVTKVARQGDNFVLSYPASATSVSVYNVTGQKVAEHKLNAGGSYTLPAANWAKGIYILKFNGTNNAVKVLK
jgi:hypothetical protein